MAKNLNKIKVFGDTDQPYRDPEIDYEALVVAKKAPRWLRALKKYGYLDHSRSVAA